MVGVTRTAYGLKYYLDMYLVFSKCFRKYQHIIQIYYCILSMWIEDLIHETYECSWYICKSKRNDLVFIETFRCNECCLATIIRMYSYLMVTTSAKNLIVTGATGASEAYGSTGSKI